MSTTYFQEPNQESKNKTKIPANNDAVEIAKAPKEHHIASAYLNLSEEFYEIKHIAVLSCN